MGVDIYSKAGADAAIGAAVAASIDSAVSVSDAVMATVQADPSSAFAKAQKTTIDAVVEPAFGGVRAPGRRWGFLGDSITNGSTAGNWSYSYVALAIERAGTVNASHAYVEAGVPGQTVVDMAARIDSLLDAGIEGLVIMAGTNDAGGSVDPATPLADFQAAYASIVRVAKRRGLPVVGCTIPPNGSNTAAEADIEMYNDWLRLWLPSEGVVVAEVWGALADPASGLMAAQYWTSPDPTHPNGAGHARMADVVGEGIRRATLALDTPLVLAKTARSLVSNPLMTGTLGSGRPGSWFEQPGGAGASAIYTKEAASDGLPAGQWAGIELDATNQASSRTLAIGLPATGAATWSPGDVLAFAGWADVTDLSGTWEASVLAGTANFTPSLRNNASSFAGSSAWVRNRGRKVGANRYSLGPWFTTMTVPAGASSLNLWVGLGLPAGAHVKARMGCVDVWNLTKLGLSGLDFGSSYTPLI